MTPPAAATNIHATAVQLRGRGILVTGASGSGKTRLALALLREAKRQGHPAAFVSDDQVLLAVRDGCLVAQAPPAIFGLVEIRGLGLARIRAEPSCTVGLIVRLVPPHAAPRVAQEEHETLMGCTVPILALPERDAEGAVLAIEAKLFGLNL